MVRESHHTGCEDLTHENSGVGRLPGHVIICHNRPDKSIVATGGLVEWTVANASIFVPTASHLVDAQAIQNRFTGLRDPRAEFEEADAYVIALAKMHSGIVVTQETSAAEKRNPRRTHFIPDVCRELGIPCINLLGLMRREGWTF